VLAQRPGGAFSHRWRSTQAPTRWADLRRSVDLGPWTRTRRAVAGRNPRPGTGLRHSPSGPGMPHHPSVFAECRVIL